MVLNFLSKKKGVGRIPVDRVQELSSHGFSDQEIIDILRKEGYSTQEISTAMTQAMTSKISESKEDTKVPKMEDIMKEDEKEPSIDYDPTQYQESANYQYTPDDYINYIDSLIQARMSDVVTQISSISSKYRELENKISLLTENMKEILNSKLSEENKILNQLDEINKSINEMSVRIGGLEKAFKETLPALIESVRALSDLVQRVKREI